MNTSDWMFDWIADRWEEAIDSVESLNDYGQNWDGEGSLPVRFGLVEATIQFLQSNRSNLPAPQDLYLAPDGTVLIEWHSEAGYATIANIREKNRVEIVYRCPGRPPLFESGTIVLPPDEHPGPAQDPDQPVSCLDEGAYGLAA